MILKLLKLLLLIKVHYIYGLACLLYKYYNNSFLDRITGYIEQLIIKIIGLRIVFNRKLNKENMIYISNHNHIFDIYPFICKKFRFIVKDNLGSEVSILKYSYNWAFYNPQYIKYKRDDFESGIEVKNKIINEYNRGYNILIFPEGTSQKCGKICKPFKKGVLKLAYDNNIPIQTMTLIYNKDIGVEKEDKTNLNKFLEIFDDIVLIVKLGKIFKSEEYNDFEVYCKEIYNNITPELWIS